MPIPNCESIAEICIEHCPAAIAILDRDLRYLFANSRWIKDFRLKDRNLTGRHHYEVFPEIPEKWKEVHRRCLAGAVEIGDEESFQRADGSVEWIHWEIRPWKTDNGEIGGIIIISELLTHRRHERQERSQAEAALRLQSAALEAAGTSILMTDRNGRIEWVNPAFVALTGWSADEAIGRTPGDLLNSGRHDESFYRNLWQTIAAGRVWRGEIVNRRKDGELRTIEMSITPLRDDTGEINHFVAIHVDVTDRKQLEAQNRQSQRIEAIGTLAGGVAHDLNNILTPVLMMSDMLVGKLTDERELEMVRMIRDGARRGGDIVRQLLAFSRGSPGERVPIQARHILKEMLNVMRETFPREIDLRLQAPNDLWTIVVEPTQLSQIILNLCVNARDAMPDGGHLALAASNVTLRETDPIRPSDSAPGAYVLIEVRDSGIGIAPLIKPRIFDPFFTTKPEGKGSGLGLSTVVGIVRGYGGFLSVESEVGLGTVFRVYIPAHADLAAAPIADEPATRASGNGRLVLMVDDERDVREATRRALEKHGFRVLAAVNGADALGIYSRHAGSVAAVLTDVMMPGMNGVSLIRELRSRGCTVPVVVTSGVGDLDKGEELNALGVKEILMKPTSVATLIDAVERSLKAVVA